MTNTTYFHSVVREPYSSSSSSSYQNSETSRLPIIQQGDETKDKDSRYIKLGFNRVFKGWMDKKFLDRQQFRQPQVGLGQAQVQLTHPNLVECFRYCLHPTPHPLNEAKPPPLADYLSNESICLLPWSLRMRVALGTAEGLAFLHRNHILYYNFEISHVLLDTKYNAKLTDYGIFDTCDEDISFMVREDVYSFGILLLEILSGRSRKAVEIIGMGLVGWAMPYLAHNSLYVLDRRLKNQYSLQNAPAVVNLAYRCLNRSKSRLTMEEVVAELKQVQDSEFMEIIVNEVPLELEIRTTNYEIMDTDTDMDMYTFTYSEEQASEWLDSDTEEQASEWLIREGR